MLERYNLIPCAEQLVTFFNKLRGKREKHISSPKVICWGLQMNNKSAQASKTFKLRQAEAQAQESFKLQSSWPDERTHDATLFKTSARLQQCKVGLRSKDDEIKATHAQRLEEFKKKHEVQQKRQDLQVWKKLNYHKDTRYQRLMMVVTTVIKSGYKKTRQEEAWHREWKSEIAECLTLWNKLLSSRCSWAVNYMPLEREL